MLLSPASIEATTQPEERRERVKRKITLLVATIAVATTMVAAPAGAAVNVAGNARECNERPGGPGFDKEDRCCVKKADTAKERKKCVRRT
jgi:hypothetical protein